MRKDNYGILEKTTEALKMIKVAEDYKQADRELMDYVGKQIKRSKSISELLNIWVDGSKGLELLRFRHNKLKGKGELPADIKMLKALDTDTDPEAVADRENYPEEYVFSKMSLDNLDNITQINDVYSLDFIVTKADKTGLACVLLLHYLNCGDYKGLNYQESIQDKLMRTLREAIYYIGSSPEFNGRERVWGFKLEDNDFMGLYGGGLKDLLTEEQSVLAIEIKKILNDLLATVWTEVAFTSGLEVASELEQVLRADKTELGIDLVEDLTITRNFAVVREYREDRIYYRVNVEALELLATMIKDLELDGLDENKLILDLIAQR